VARVGCRTTSWPHGRTRRGVRIAFALLLVFGVILALIYFGILSLGDNVLYPHVGPSLN
jgi:hypothetical protein